MAVQPTYPGVYVQEVPSGVRTITGVSTSIAVFLGRTKQGPLNLPVLCLNFSDFERTFSAEYAGSDLARAVRLFFLNGGTQCYVMRIADGAVPASVDLKNEQEEAVLTVTAKSVGVIGNNIRLGVTYDTQYPESTFNVEVFRWVTNNGGQQIKADREIWQALSMDPLSPKYAPLYITQNSKLIEVKLHASLSTPPSDDGYSRSARPLPSTNSEFATALASILYLSNEDLTKRLFRFRINVKGNAADIDISGVDLTSANPNDIIKDIEGRINNNLPSDSSITVSLVAGPNGTSLIKFVSVNGDVRIEPASSNDLARALMLGTAQGGIECSRFAVARPAPTGIVFNLNNLVSFAEQAQTAFNTIRINTSDIELTNTLQTAAEGSLMYQDGVTPLSSVTGNSDGVREKWSIIANAINEKQASDTRFRWSAQVWGSRLALISGENGDNIQGAISTSGGGGVNINGSFVSNVRYYSLGDSGTGNFQTGGAKGNDGNSPTLRNYRDAFEILDKEVDIFNLMLLPADSGHTETTANSLWGPASIFCQQRRAFLLMDAPPRWKTVQDAIHPTDGVNNLRIGLVKDHSAIFYPRITIKENGLNVQAGPSGAIAGLMARIDSNRGVWKAPAGTEADIRGVTGLEYRFSDGENGVLNPQGINTLRVFPNGIVNWGARTMDGDDDFASEWKYIPVRRTALFIEESLYRGLKWVVFEPNDEPLWSQIRVNVGAFMHNLFRQGAFQGQSPKDAYFVKCDRETTTQNDINLGIVNVWVGFAPLKPAEFVILYLQQMTGKINQ